MGKKQKKKGLEGKGKGGKKGKGRTCLSEPSGKGFPGYFCEKLSARGGRRFERNQRRGEGLKGGGEVPPSS